MYKAVVSIFINNNEECKENNAHIFEGGQAVLGGI